MTLHTIGVDISKDTLDAHIHPSGEDRRFSNDANGFRALIKWVAPLAVQRLVFEATGAYHRALETALIKDRTAAKNREKSLSSPNSASPRSHGIWTPSRPRCWPSSKAMQS